MRRRPGIEPGIEIGAELVEQDVVAVLAEAVVHLELDIVDENRPGGFEIGQHLFEERVDALVIAHGAARDAEAHADETAFEHLLHRGCLGVAEMTA